MEQGQKRNDGGGGGDTYKCQPGTSNKSTGTRNFESLKTTNALTLFGMFNKHGILVNLAMKLVILLNLRIKLVASL